MNPEASCTVIELSNGLVKLMGEMKANWTSAFFRYCLEPSRAGSVASYVSPDGVAIVDPFKHSVCFGRMNSESKKLLNVLQKDRGVILVMVNRDLNYDVKFEFEDLDRWGITKLNGGTGIPTGVHL